MSNDDNWWKVTWDVVRHPWVYAQIIAWAIRAHRAGWSDREIEIVMLARLASGELPMPKEKKNG